MRVTISGLGGMGGGERERARILFGSAVVRKRNSRHNILGGLYEWSAWCIGAGHVG